MVWSVESKVIIVWGVWELWAGVLEPWMPSTMWRDVLSTTSDCHGIPTEWPPTAVFQLMMLCEKGERQLLKITSGPPEKLEQNHKEHSPRILRRLTHMRPKC
eukprot:4226452-Pyramimonas_sp.AAC.1